MIGADHDIHFGIRYEWTSRSAYEGLARYHYRAACPATIAPRSDGSLAIVGAFDTSTPERVTDASPIGVLVISMPTLNASWRELAWPGRFTPRPGVLSKREAAQRMNTELRCISRVIVEPRYRALGVGSGLVRWYLGRTLTPCTEAIASMGAFCPFFERAGMTPYPLPPGERDARLLDALAAAHAQPSDLLLHDRTATLLQSHRWLGREIALWANASRATRALSKHADTLDLAQLAAASIASTRTAYAHTANPMS